MVFQFFLLLVLFPDTREARRMTRSQRSRDDLFPTRSGLTPHRLSLLNKQQPLHTNIPACALLLSRTRTLDYFVYILINHSLYAHTQVNKDIVRKSKLDESFLDARVLCMKPRGKIQSICFFSTERRIAWCLGG